MKGLKKTIVIFLSLLMVFCITPITDFALPDTSGVIEAQAAVKLNYKKKKLVQYDTFQLKISGTTKSVKWSSSKKKVATVSKTGKVTAKKPGKATITAKIGKKKYKCVVTVVKWYSENGTWTKKIGTRTWYFDINDYTSVEPGEEELGVVYIYAGKSNFYGDNIAAYGEYCKIGANKYRMEYEGGTIDFTVSAKSIQLEQKSGDVLGVKLKGKFNLLRRHYS